MAAMLRAASATKGTDAKESRNGDIPDDSTGSDKPEGVNFFYVGVLSASVVLPEGSSDITCLYYVVSGLGRNPSGGASSSVLSSGKKRFLYCFQKIPSIFFVRSQEKDSLVSLPERNNIR